MTEKPVSDANTTDAASSDEVRGADVTASQAGGPADVARPPLRPLRSWPAALLLVGLWTVSWLPRFFEEAAPPIMMAGMMGPLLFVLLILVWWVFLSRATVAEKVLGLLGLALIITVTSLLADKSIQGFGMVIYALPCGITAFAAGLVLLGRMTSRKRTWIALLAALFAFGFWDLVRTDEIWGDFQTARSWRWEPTAEERFLASLDERQVAGEGEPPAEISAAIDDAPWPAFRGPKRRGVQPGVVLSENWQTRPPRELWRVRIGPGWSSFSVADDRLFTQEQRGDEEVVSCYDASTGTQLWVHADQSRFWEAVGGAGPRATPTLHQGMLFALGAKGLLNRLDPATGEQIWEADINADAGREPPTWGYASSPLVTHDVVIVHAGGDGDKGLLAYDVEAGELRWSVPAGDHSYSSPQLSELDGRTCVLMLTNQGLTFVDPAEGKLLGQYDWRFAGYRVVQPLVVGESSVLLGTPMGTGTRRIEVRFRDDELVAEQEWTSRRMNPYYNDYVAHEGYLYGFDNNIFACVDLETGERVWKQGRYGNGQVLLLPDADQLLVTSEDGELVLLRATPDTHEELARYQVLEGRTWNHPVLVGNRLYVRNGEEAACYEMPLAKNET
jgi:outer membrane protein assembly factor BamB